MDNEEMTPPAPQSHEQLLVGWIMGGMMMMMMASSNQEWE